MNKYIWNIPRRKSFCFKHLFNEWGVCVRCGYKQLNWSDLVEKENGNGK